ncbi:MAG: A/G-specific adenine glycosylase [Gemmatimonadetes bacterium]|nr:A/G-specific adenine glycosylase [Gemmatimonadota bacterium]MDA1102195.1 A/G-specific adenine glycosylase [Gemmatimonadota bacterium]
MKYQKIDLTATTRLRRALLEYYDRAARDLPWRLATDPYRVLVSEVMLQQTRVETVKSYYVPWLEQFPGIAELAAANDDEVMKAWEGLGYYRRARNLHQSARVVRESHNGEIPSDYAGLRSLPGVGEYTAGAVASIAFGERVPAVDGNVRRVLARLFDVSEPGTAWLRDTAAALVDESRPGDWNQALMELGATLCTPRSPTCEACPVARWCAARALGTQAERPMAKTSPHVKESAYVLAVFHRDGRVLLAKRPPDGLLAGLWAFPERPVLDGIDAAEVTAEMAAEWGLEPVGPQLRLPDCPHRFSHLNAVYMPWSIEVVGAPDGAESNSHGARWVRPDVRAGVALPVAQRKVLDSWSDQQFTDQQLRREP